MGWQFETLGNAMVQLFHDEQPVLVTDPWLVGSAYFGSWELERPLTPRQIGNAAASRFIWFSHGHPDHFHPPSFQHLSRDSLVLVPDQYDDELARGLAEHGFRCRVLPQKQWVTLADGLRVLCVANENMDAILAIDAGGVLVLDKNDSPFCGEDGFFRRLVKGFRDSYLLALCAFDADMINVYDAGLHSLLGPAGERKPGTVWSVARTAEYLGVGTFCCSSSQHVYVRADSAWANDYRITWDDMQRLWPSSSVRLVAPYSHVDLATGEARAADSPATRPVAARVHPDTGEDDWNATLSESEWAEVERFARQFETLKAWQDFVGFTVGGETRSFLIRPRAARKPADKRVGVNFHVPRASLLDTIKYGYFDDLLIGNFMRAQLFNMELYPHFTPLVAKLGGNAKVFTSAALRRFRAYYFRASPPAFLRFRWQLLWSYMLLPRARRWARAAGVFDVLKKARARAIGAPRPLS